jgi:hypothetical protein
MHWAIDRRSAVLALLAAGLLVLLLPRPAHAGAWGSGLELDPPDLRTEEEVHLVAPEELRLDTQALSFEHGPEHRAPLSVQQEPRPGPKAPAMTAAVESLGAFMVMTTWNRTVGAARWANTTPKSVAANLTSPWVLDDNLYFINQMGHPLQGSVSFGAARSAGLGFWGSTAYPFAFSALWELAGETERPALNDQITTTVGAIVLGEILYRASDWIRGDGRSAWRQAAATLISPLSTVNRTVVTGGDPEPGAPLRLSAGLGMVTTAPAPALDGAVAPAFDLKLTNGVPGSPGWKFNRPFDHFDLALLFAPAPDPVVSLRARGVLAGSEFAEGPSGGGLWGLWLSFDLASPGERRVSTSALGVGGTGRWRLAPSWTFDGTAVASAVILGASGVTTPVGDRTYRFGPGAQAVLETALSWEDRFRLSFDVRPYLVVASGVPGGRDAMLETDLSARARLWGHHAVEATATRYLRLATEADGSSAMAQGTTLMITWRWMVEPAGAGISPG